MDDGNQVGASGKGGSPTGRMKRVCVYCGSSPGHLPVFADAAEALGRHLAAGGIELVYGGGDVGLMGIVAQSVLRHGGRVTGIIPEFLRRRENMLQDVHELIVVPDMHSRKQQMFDRSDAFVALPGGIGTLEELVEQMTWAQLGRHAKPILLLDIAGFWSPLVELLQHMHRMGFIRPGLELSYLVAESPAEVIPRLLEAARQGAGRDANAFIREHF